MRGDEHVYRRTITSMEISQRYIKLGISDDDDEFNLNTGLVTRWALALLCVLTPAPGLTSSCLEGCFCTLSTPSTLSI